MACVSSSLSDPSRSRAASGLYIQIGHLATVSSYRRNNPEVEVGITYLLVEELKPRGLGRPPEVQKRARAIQNRPK